MRPLIIDHAAKTRIAAVRAYAEAPKNLNDLTMVMDGRWPPPGENPNHVVEIEVDFRVVYSLDRDKDGVIWKHLSVSVKNPPGQARVPSPEAVQMLTEEFGFDPKQGIQMALTGLVAQAIQQTSPTP